MRARNMLAGVWVLTIVTVTVVAFRRPDGQAPARVSAVEAPPAPVVPPKSCWVEVPEFGGAVDLPKDCDSVSLPVDDNGGRVPGFVTAFCRFVRVEQGAIGIVGFRGEPARANWLDPTGRLRLVALRCRDESRTRQIGGRTFVEAEVLDPPDAECEKVLARVLEMGWI